MTTLTPIALPLAADEFGAIRIAGTRVTLDLLIEAYQGGASATEIAEEFDTLRLSDIHLVIGYYLQNQAEVDEYLTRRETEARERQTQFEREYPPRISQEVLLDRWTARQEK